MPAVTPISVGVADMPEPLDIDLATAIAATQSYAQQALDARDTVLGLGALRSVNNLSDLGNAATARTNLGLGSAATHAATDFDASGAAAGALATAEAYTDTKVDALVNSAPGILDTLGEIATQLQSDESVASALATTVAGKMAKSANLSDVANAATARSNLGILALATVTPGAGVATALGYAAGAANGVATLDASGKVPSAQLPADMTGFRNRLINGNFDIWQRGTNISVANVAFVRLADLWSTWNYTGVTASISKIAAPSGFVGRQALNVTATGVASDNGLWLHNRFEGRAVADLDGQPMVASFDINATTSAGAILVYLILLKNGALDDSSYSIQSAYHAITVPVGSGRVVVPFSASDTAGLKYGGEVAIQIVQYGATGNINVSIGAVQFEADRQIAGAWGNPTPFEFRPFSVELVMSQRYYEKSFDQAVAPATNTGNLSDAEFDRALGASLPVQHGVRFKVEKRTAPTVTLYNTNAANAQMRDQDTGADCTGTAALNAGTSGFRIYAASPAGAGAGDLLTIHWTADAEL